MKGRSPQNVDQNVKLLLIEKKVLKYCCKIQIISDKLESK